MGCRPRVELLVWLAVTSLLVGVKSCENGECPAGTYDTGNSGEAQCVAWTECVSGEYVVSAGTAKADRVCGSCESEASSIGPNAPSCTPNGHGRCELGEYRVMGSCMVWSDCPAGTYVEAAGTDRSDRVCRPCPDDSFSVGVNEATCTPRQDCAAGSYVGAGGSSTTDRVCAPCADGTFSDTANASACGAWQDCFAGTHIGTAGSAVADRTCTLCDAGTFSGTANELECAAWQVCAPGTYVGVAGTSMANQTCEPCPSETFSDAFDAATCVPWTVCGVAEVEKVPGSPSGDRVCGWEVQFGTGRDDMAAALTIDSDGSVIVAGETKGNLAGLGRAGGKDVFVRKYDPSGVEAWTRQFGTSGDDAARAVDVSSDGTIAVAGFTRGDLAGYGGGSDGFVRLYDADGVEQWTRQIATASNDYAWDVAVGADGSIYVAGRTHGDLGGGGHLGVDDAFVRKYDFHGVEQWTWQFGTGQSDSAEAIRVASDGAVIVGGYTLGTLDGPQLGVFDAFIRVYEADGTIRWAEQFGTNGSEWVQSLGVGLDGSVHASGFSHGDLAGTGNEGEQDAFVRKYDLDGLPSWTAQLGSPQAEEAVSLSVSSQGQIVIAGFTYGDLDGMGNRGSVDAFVSLFDPSGTELWTQQFGTPAGEILYGAHFDLRGRPVVAGYTSGDLITTNAGNFDAFVMRVIAP